MNLNRMVRELTFERVLALVAFDIVPSDRTNRNYNYSRIERFVVFKGACIREEKSVWRALAYNGLAFGSLDSTEIFSVDKNQQNFAAER